MAPRLDELINRVDLDGLVRYVDDTCSSRDWPHLLTIRNDARAAVATGRQLWPIATLANYRLALWAPGSIAARALDDTARTFMPGPVSEILAVNHTWADLEPHLEHGHDRSLFAYERALRGDHIDTNEFAALDIPFAPQSWEQTYALATYTDDGGSFPAPGIPTEFTTDTSTAAPHVLTDDTTTEAFRDLVEPWTAHSNGRAEISCVEGDGASAIRALGVTNAQMHELSHGEAFQWLAWAGANGGAHGKRRGAATGRFGAWWLMSHIVSIADEWPVDPDQLGAIVSGLRYWWWDTNEPRTGWQLRLAVEDKDELVAFALTASDSA